MIFKCKNCGGDLEYSVVYNKMLCSHCGSVYGVNEVSPEQNVKEKKEEPKVASNPVNVDDLKIVRTESIYDLSNPKGFASEEVGDYKTVLERKKEEEEREENRNHATVKMQIMRCTSCGAELAVNGVEMSTFCAYCGQATVVKDRMEDYLKPDYIIPFKITRDVSEEIIRRRLNNGFFVPKGIKNFETEKIRGIYVPFWLFDMRYADRQYYKYTKKQGKATVTRFEYIEGETTLKKFTLDASLNLNDDSSTRLEPYDMRQLKEFDMAYLSGYYSDRFDIGAAEITGDAVIKAGTIYNEEIRNYLKHQGGKLVKSDPNYEVYKTEYALLPAWFLSFKYDNKPFTILVNGQTGKMVGAVPFVKAKAAAVFALLSLLMCPVGIALNVFISQILFFNDEINDKLTGTYAIGVPVLIFLIAGAGFKSYKAMMKSLNLTTEKRINKYAKERQDK